MQSRIFGLTLSLLFFTGACGDDGGATQGPDPGDGTTTGMSTTTDAQPTTGATTGETSTTDDTTADPSTSSEGTTNNGTDATTGEPATDTGATSDGETDTTGGEPDPEIVSACADYCGRWGECGFQPDLDGCVAGCADNLQGAAGECKDASVAALACKTALECEELLDAIGDGGPCSAAEAEAAQACDEAGCAESFFVEDDACEFSRECEGEPLQQMNCAGDGCTCLEGGQQTGQCAADGACLDADALAAKAAACCGFD